ncbi:serine hydrolase domain-containing protein [Lactiplantibacillus pentosus]|uniref:serine hydrolase domain-containing protein n=1 Tax=Lactiplantibacillus pentosus TaxID=1589 RepID=UPI000B545D11|nr:serine hydrolase domain-containing protein [Lactiplantibacillus pentosus]ASG78868.1 peptidase S12 [Lactiplantibacillus pentosus]MCT3286489.1 class A beta-lactamase-related serine hydrolase [Lactiplantibacillus pentosus]
MNFKKLKGMTGKPNRQIRLPVLSVIIIISVLIVTMIVILITQFTQKQINRVSADNVTMTTIKKSEKNNNKYAKLLHSVNFVGTALVVKNNKVVYFEGNGYSNYQAGWTNNIKSIYQINGVQNSMTAVLLMKLVQEHKAKLSDPISKYYPKIVGGQNITLLDMLQMRSGLSSRLAPQKSTTDNDVLNYYVDNIRYNTSEMDVWRYSEVNYNLLAGVIEKVTGKSYEDVFNTEIKNYLGLQQTGFIYDGFSKQKYSTIGYANKSSDSHIVNYRNIQTRTKGQAYSALGTGNIYMSAADLYTVESAISRGKIISKNSLAVLRQADKNKPHYNGGVYSTRNTYYAGGGGYGYETYFKMDKSGRTGVILMSNYYQKNSPIEYVANKLFSDVYHKK